MTERTKKLIRQYKKYLGSPDAEKMVAFMAAALQKQPLPELEDKHLKILRDFSSFSDAIESAYAEYEDRMNMAARNIEISSKELTTAYRDVERLNTSINAMLDSLGQGLLFFDKNGICSDIYSKSCVELLGGDPSDKYLPEFLNFSSDEASTFKSWINITFAGNSAMDFDDLKGLLPKEMTNGNGRIIDLNYKPMYVVDGMLSGVLLIATDITYEKETEAKILQTQEEAEKIKQIALNRNGFYDFITDISNFVDTLKALPENNVSQEQVRGILRSLHTFKGTAGSFHLIELSRFIHSLEMVLKKNSDSFEKSSLDIASFEELIEKKKDLGRTLFGSEFMQYKQIKAVRYDTLENLSKIIDTVVPDGSAKKTIQKFLKDEIFSVSIREKFYPFERELYRIAEQQGKPHPKFVFHGEEISVVPTEYEEFFKVLLHIARNIVDHGIEKPQTRERLHKPMEGTVKVDISRKGSSGLSIDISDDGGGIDVDRIRAKMPQDQRDISDEEVLQKIFHIGFSSKESASLVSGQGIGLNAVYDTITNVGGSISVSSNFKDHKGTIFHINLP